MIIRINNDRWQDYGVRKGDEFEVLAKNTLKGHLIEVPLGAQYNPKERYKDISPNYDVEKHQNRKYAWVYATSFDIVQGGNRAMAKALLKKEY